MIFVFEAQVSGLGFYNFLKAVNFCGLNSISIMLELGDWFDPEGVPKLKFYLSNESTGDPIWTKFQKCYFFVTFLAHLVLYTKRKWFSIISSFPHFYWGAGGDQNTKIS